MALTPSRSRRSRAKKVARNLVVADALYALFGSWSGKGRSSAAASPAAGPR